MADLYDIRKIIRTAENTLARSAELVVCDSIDQLPEIVKQYIFEAVSCSKLVQLRVDYIVDPILKKRLTEPLEVIRMQPEKEVELTAGIFQVCRHQ